jgi:hypothetical protein
MFASPTTTTGPKALAHRSQGQRPWKLDKATNSWPKAIFTRCVQKRVNMTFGQEHRSASNTQGDALGYDEIGLRPNNIVKVEQLQNLRVALEIPSSKNRVVTKHTSVQECFCLFTFTFVEFTPTAMEKARKKIAEFPKKFKIIDDSYVIIGLTTIATRGGSKK